MFSRKLPFFRELHAEKRQAVLAFAHFVNRKNVWMIQDWPPPVLLVGNVAALRVNQRDN
jgi:hypothetical protein